MFNKKGIFCVNKYQAHAVRALKDKYTRLRVITTKYFCYFAWRNRQKLLFGVVNVLQENREIRKYFLGITPADCFLNAITKQNIIFVAAVILCTLKTKFSIPFSCHRKQNTTRRHRMIVQKKCYFHIETLSIWLPCTSSNTAFIYLDIYRAARRTSF